VQSSVDLSELFDNMRIEPVPDVNDWRRSGTAGPMAFPEEVPLHGCEAGRIEVAGLYPRDQGG